MSNNLALENYSCGDYARKFVSGDLCTVINLWIHLSLYRGGSTEKRL